MNSKLLLAATACLIAIAGCDPVDQLAAGSSAAEETSRAIEALQIYFGFLSEGDYQSASSVYGGSYDVLRESNPSTDPDDLPALLKSACEVNGFKCLPVSEVVEARRISPGEFMISASFLESDGQIFVRGPCCGTTEEDTPAESVFEFRVNLNEAGNYTVMDLPVYVP